jgi:hypothetical protein
MLSKKCEISKTCDNRHCIATKSLGVATGATRTHKEESRKGKAKRNTPRGGIEPTVLCETSIDPDHWTIEDVVCLLGKTLLI